MMTQQQYVLWKQKCKCVWLQKCFNKVSCKNLTINYLICLFNIVKVLPAFPSQSSVRSSPHAPWSSSSSWNSRRSSWNSVGRAPSLKRQKRQSGERRSLLSGDGHSSSDEDGAGGGSVGRRMLEGDNVSLSRTDSFGQRPRHRRMESLETRSSFDLPPDTLQVPYLHRSASIHSTRPPNLISNGKSSPTGATTQLSLDDHHSEDDNADEEGNLVRTAAVLSCCILRVDINKLLTLQE